MKEATLLIYLEMTTGLQATVAIFLFLHLVIYVVNAQLSFNPSQLRKDQQQAPGAGVKAHKATAPAAGQLAQSRFGQPMQVGRAHDSQQHAVLVETEPVKQSGGFLEQLGTQKHGSPPKRPGLGPLQGATLAQPSTSPSVVPAEQQEIAEYGDYDDYDEKQPKQVPPEVVGQILQQLPIQAGDSISDSANEAGGWVKLQSLDSLQSAEMTVSPVAKDDKEVPRILAKLQGPNPNNNDAAHKVPPSKPADKQQQPPSKSAAQPKAKASKTHARNASSGAYSGAAAYPGYGYYSYDGPHYGYGSYDNYGYGYDNGGNYGSYGSYDNYGYGYDNGGNYGGYAGYDSYGAYDNHGMYDGYNGYGYASPYGGYGGGGYGHNRGHYGGDSFNHYLAEKKPGPIHCGVCCPHTNITKEKEQDILLVRQVYTATASCPKTNFSSDEYSNKCKHDNTTNFQYGGSCKLECTNPLDYLLVTPTESGWTSGCSDCEDAQTTCSFIAVNSPDAQNEPPYSGTCTITAVAKCCKQLCKEKHHEVHHVPHKPSYDYGYSPDTKDNYDNYKPKKKDSYHKDNYDTYQPKKKNSYYQDTYQPKKKDSYYQDTYQPKKKDSYYKEPSHSKDTYCEDGYEQPCKGRSSYAKPDKNTYYHEDADDHDGSYGYDEHREEHSSDRHQEPGSDHHEYSSETHGHDNDHSREAHRGDEGRGRKRRSKVDYMVFGSVFKAEEQKDGGSVELQGADKDKGGKPKSQKVLKREGVGDGIPQTSGTDVRKQAPEARGVGNKNGGSVKQHAQPTKPAPASSVGAKHTLGRPSKSAEVATDDAAEPSSDSAGPSGSPPPPHKWVQPRKAYLQGPDAV